MFNNLKKYAINCLQRILWILVIFFIHTAVSARPPETPEKVIPWDEQGKIEYRSPPDKIIESYKNNPAYNYHQEVDRPGFLSRLWTLIWQQIIGRMQQRGWVQYAFLIVIVTGFVFMLLRLLNIPVIGLFSFYRKGEISNLEMTSAEGYPEEEEELNRLYQVYKNNGACREAVRILYLLYLRKLEKNGLIRIRPWKTNREYIREINNQVHQNNFQKLSKMYDYVWFGQYDPPTEHFNKIEHLYNRCIAVIK